MENIVIRLEEGTKQCSVTVISSPLRADNSTWEKDGVGMGSLLEQGISVDGFTITFDEIAREEIGNYSVTSSIPCHQESNPRNFSGNFILDVICKLVFHMTTYLTYTYYLFRLPNTA